MRENVIRNKQRKERLFGSSWRTFYRPWNSCITTCKNFDLIRNFENIYIYVWIILGTLYTLHRWLCGSDLSGQLGLENANHRSSR